MSVYSTLFFHGSLGANTLTPLYTVPGPQTVVIRDIEQFTGLASDLFNLQINVSGSLAIVWYISGSPASTWHQWSGRVVVPGGGVIEAYSSAGQDQLVVSGYLLSP